MISQASNRRRLACAEGIRPADGEIGGSDRVLKVLRLIAGRLEHGEMEPGPLDVTFFIL